MTKKQLYILIAVLGTLLIIVLFIPTQKTQTPTQEDVEVQSEQVEEVLDTDLPVVTDEVLEGDDVDDVKPSVVLKGTFVGLLDGEDAYQKKFKYMLLNDGEEVLRIDLRPLVQYSDINIIEKLGVERGTGVVVTGVMHKDEFKVQSIE